MSKPTLSDELAAISAKRGYLLAHHGLLAVSGNGLLAAYDELYSAINLKARTLSRHDHEFVWLAVLVTCREPLATHHLKRFQDEGGTNAELATAVAIATIAGNADAFNFVSDNWSVHVPGVDVQETYLSAFLDAAASTDPALAHIAAVAVHACTENHTALRWHIAEAYALGVDELAIAEGLSIAMFPGGVPKFASAAETWRRMIERREVEASDAFTAWANTAGQGGFDQASGVPPSSSKS